MNELYEKIKEKGFDSLSKKARLLYFYLCLFSEDGIISPKRLMEMIPLVECGGEGLSVFSFEEKSARFKKHLNELESADLIRFSDTGHEIYALEFVDFILG